MRKNLYTNVYMLYTKAHVCFLSCGLNVCACIRLCTCLGTCMLLIMCSECMWRSVHTRSVHACIQCHMLLMFEFLFKKQQGMGLHFSCTRRKSMMVFLKKTKKKPKFLLGLELVIEVKYPSSWHDTFPSRNTFFICFFFSSHRPAAKWRQNKPTPVTSLPAVYRRWSSRSDRGRPCSLLWQQRMLVVPQRSAQSSQWRPRRWGWRQAPRPPSTHSASPFWASCWRGGVFC